MNLQNRKNAFVTLGTILNKFLNNSIETDTLDDCEKHFFNNLEVQINQAVHYNGWFTKANVYYALEIWSTVLSKENMNQWTEAYDFSKTTQKTIGIVMAGNIPLVGFHDFISVLISGHQLLIKLASNDQKLLPLIADFLICSEPSFKDLIIFQEGKLQNFDAVIATGSNNTARYFEHYFKKYPSIIRKNRNAIAVLTGKETLIEMEALGEDIFRYFGLGCRSVSKIFVPKDYDFDSLFKAVYKQKDILDYEKYKNNYTYNKTVYLMSQMPLLENGFLVLKEDKSYASPIATLFYEYYETLEQINIKIQTEQEQIQCTVSNGVISNSIPFGTTQLPQLWDYADGVDTLEFLLNL